MSIRSRISKLGLDYDELSHGDKLHVFVGRLVDLGKITEGDFDRFSIKYSGIPKCCVEHFFNLISQDINPYEHMAQYHNHPKGPVDYVMCPKCIKEKKS